MMCVKNTWHTAGLLMLIFLPFQPVHRFHRSGDGVFQILMPVCHLWKRVILSEPKLFDCKVRKNKSKFHEWFKKKEIWPRPTTGSLKTKIPEILSYLCFITFTQVIEDPNQWDIRLFPCGSAWPQYICLWFYKEGLIFQGQVSIWGQLQERNNMWWLVVFFFFLLVFVLAFGLLPKTVNQWDIFLVPSAFKYIYYTLLYSFSDTTILQ